jgi:hypothetical protein
MVTLRAGWKVNGIQFVQVLLCMCGICFGSDFTDETKCPLVVNISGSKYQQMNGAYILGNVDLNGKVNYYRFGFFVEHYILSYEDDDKETPFWSIRSYKTAVHKRNIPCPHWARLHFAESPINEQDWTLDWEMMNNETPVPYSKIIVAAAIQSVSHYGNDVKKIADAIYDKFSDLSENMNKVGEITRDLLKQIKKGNRHMEDNISEESESHIKEDNIEESKNDTKHDVH